MSGPLCKASACRTEQIVHNLRRARTVALRVLQDSVTHRRRTGRHGSATSPALCYHAIDGMRIALAQINPISGDISGNTARSSTRSATRRPRRRSSSSRRRWRCRATASATWSRTPNSSRPTSARCSASPAPREASPQSSDSSTSTLRAERHRHGAEVQRGRGGSRRPGPAARAQNAAPELPLLRRQAVFHAGRSARAGRRRRRARPLRLGRLDLRGHVGRLLRRQAARELADKGASVLLNLNASPFYPGKRHDPRRG